MRTLVVLAWLAQAAWATFLTFAYLALGIPAVVLLGPWALVAGATAVAVIVSSSGRTLIASATIGLLTLVLAVATTVTIEPASDAIGGVPLIATSLLAVAASYAALRQRPRVKR